MNYFPIFVDLKGASCVVIGGGEVAQRKISLLLRAGAVVTVVAPDLCPRLAEAFAKSEIQHVDETFTEKLLDGARLVIAATDDVAVNRMVSEAATRRGQLVNVVDAPELCTFIIPSIVDRSPVVVAVSTAGTSPVLARMLRARLETVIPAGYGRLASLLETFRDQVKARFANTRERRRFWENILAGPVVEKVFSGRENEAAEAIKAAIDRGTSVESGLELGGEVYLVGAGPGDPDLLTFRALRLMQMADVVLYDRLVSDEIMELVRRDAERIYVGKKRDFHSVRQEEISQMLADLARQGKRVLRLKGGDPFIFGRGGEEIDTLSEQGIAFQVVPGITAASGCASYAGIPLTHRDYAQSVMFVTGHLQDGVPELNWQRLVAPRQTVVIYMGLSGIDVLCSKLVEHGLAATTPAAIIERGTTPQQRVIIATLATLAGEVAKVEVHAPTLIIVGDVVSLHGKLNWFNPQKKS